MRPGAGVETGGGAVTPVWPALFLAFSVGMLAGTVWAVLMGRRRS